MALLLALCDMKQVIDFLYASDSLSVKWKIVTFPFPWHRKKNKQQF